jgi:predicted N-acetyltransferase YhbS
MTDLTTTGKLPTPFFTTASKSQLTKLTYPMETPAGLIIRPELSNDYGKISRLHDLAFRHPGEGRRVEALRHSPLFIKGLSLVSIIGGNLIGHILFFPILIKGEGKVFRSLALSPIAVLPDFQRKGIGTALVNSGLDEARAGKFGSVVAQGPLDFFSRFGFRPASGFGIFPPIEVPDTVLLAIELQNDGLFGVCGIVEYTAEFTLV